VILYRQINASVANDVVLVPHQAVPDNPLAIQFSPDPPISSRFVTDDEIPDRAFIDILKDLQDTPFEFFETTLPTIGARPLNSDVVELRHCHLGHIDYLNFTKWATVIIDDAWPNFDKKVKSWSTDVMDLSKFAWENFMVPEFALGLLEVFATHNGRCDFNKYPLQIANYDLNAAEAVLTKTSKVLPSEASLPRLTIIIVAFRDAQHLSSIIKAVHLPHHFIVIHLERTTPPSYTAEVYQIAAEYQNVAVAQFGTVTYRTDSVSMINYQIMNWLVNDLKLEYDYHLTLGGAVYPLYGAKELALHLQEARRDVWLGELLHNGAVLTGDEHSQWEYLVRKRLIFTSGERKYQQRTKKTNQNGFVASIPKFIQTNMTKKTTSGNQAVFSHKFVKEMTNSAEVKELFAIAKYGCCCCLEERTWITAARIIGYKDQALESASMFQVWGGDTTCGTSMNNAVLSVNASICYKNEDATDIIHEAPSKKVGDPVYLRGDEMVQALKNAKKRGFMFARKFKSEDPVSMELLGLIQKELHH
jgi:hypothetical protein